MQIDRNVPVMVTGATGYVAGHVVRRLLEEGLTVHAAVRDPGNAAKLQYLDAIAEREPGSIRYFRADLLDPGSYAAAMDGCGVVFHTASPFRLEISDPQKELVDPAKLGTRNVLEEACRTDSVRRIVVTSSCAAIYGDNADLDGTPNGVFTEETWNSSSSLQHQPYSFSKTLAEKEAWKIAAAQDRWDLVAVNPSLVIGPGISPFGTSGSFDLVRRLGDGTMRIGTARWGSGVVDVRDLAEAHLRAAFIPQANGRYIISGYNSDMYELAQALLPRYGDAYPIPRRVMPRWLVWLVGPLANKALTRRTVSRNVDRPWRADNSRSREELGMEYRPMEESINDFFQQLIDSGQLPPRN